MQYNVVKLMLFKIIQFYKKYWNELEDTAQHYFEKGCHSVAENRMEKIFLVAGVQETE